METAEVARDPELEAWMDSWDNIDTHETILTGWRRKVFTYKVELLKERLRALPREDSRTLQWLCKRGPRTGMDVIVLLDRAYMMGDRE